MDTEKQELENAHQQMPIPPLEEIKEKVWTSLGRRGTNELFYAGLIMYYSMIVGTDPASLSNHTKIPVEFIQKIEPNLRKHGIWCNCEKKEGEHVTGAEWFDEQHGGLTFAIDCFRALGMFGDENEEPPACPLEIN